MGRLVHCVVVVLAIGGSACGGGSAGRESAGDFSSLLEARTPLGEKVHIVPHEVLRYKLYLRGFVGGESTIAVGEPGVVEGRRVVIARSRTVSTGFARAIKVVHDDITSHLDMLTGAAVFQKANVQYGAKEASIKTHFSATGVDIEYRRKGKPERRYRHRLPAGNVAFDAHGVMALVRGWSARPGDKAIFYIMSGRRLWRNEVTAVRVESIKTELGKYRVLRIEGRAQRLTRSLRDDSRKKRRDYVMWVTLDEHRKLLRVKASTDLGEVRADLVEYSAPEERYVQQ